MRTPREPRSPRPVDDPRWTHLPGVGPVPTGPRGQDRFRDNDNRPDDRLRPAPDRNERRDHRMDQRQHERYVQQDRDDAARSDHHNTFDDENSDLLGSGWHNPAHYLAEGFARRQQNLRREARRLDRPMTYPEPRRRFRNRVWVNQIATDSRAHYSEDSILIQNTIIKQEPSEDTSIHPSVPEYSESQENISNSAPTSPATLKDSEDALDLTEALADPLTVSSAALSPPLGDLPDADVVKKQCICPINSECGAKRSGEIDCRTLVLEEERWRQWKKGFHQDSRPELPPDVDESDEPFVTLAEVTPIVKSLDDISRRLRRSMGLKVTYGNIRTWIRRMQHHSIDEDILLQANVVKLLGAFVSDNNQPLITLKEVPEEIIEELTILHHKWEFGDLSVLPQRGLTSTGYPDANWPYKRSAQFFGHGHLVNGQVWGRRAEMMRDGAHGCSQAGIYGSREDGARAVVMGFHDEQQKRYYGDIDKGEIIEYIGTALPRAIGDHEATNIKDPGHGTYRPDRITNNSKGQGPTEATHALFTSLRTGIPVRVFRSFKLAAIVKASPLKGYRYDGLYVVEEAELLKIERQIYKFKMVRQSHGQGPLRHANPPIQPEPVIGKRKR